VLGGDFSADLQQHALGWHHVHGLLRSSTVSALNVDPKYIQLGNTLAVKSESLANARSLVN
jgi:hypothetical protein